MRKCKLVLQQTNNPIYYRYNTITNNWRFDEDIFVIENIYNISFYTILLVKHILIIVKTGYDYTTNTCISCKRKILGRYNISLRQIKHRWRSWLCACSFTYCIYVRLFIQLWIGCICYLISLRNVSMWT